MGSSCLYQDLPHGITLIDTGYHRPRFDASYLVVAGGEAALVDVGTSHSVPRLLQVLADKRLARARLIFSSPPLPSAVGWGCLGRSFLIIFSASSAPAGRGRGPATNCALG